MPAEGSFDAFVVRTTPRPACPLCSGAGERRYPELFDTLFGTAGVWSMRQCSSPSCGLLWLDPAPVEADLWLLYVSYLTHGGRPVWRIALAAAHRILIGPLMRAVADGDWQRRRRLYLDDMPPGRLLDVGCGSGEFLQRMRRRGWAVQGVEIDEQAVAFARRTYGLNVHHGDLSTADIPCRSVDAVTLSHVVEHVHAPVALLSHAAQLVKPGGRMVVVTPNALSLGHLRFGRAWVGLDPPRHLQVFTPAALRNCAGEAGMPGASLKTSAARAAEFDARSESVCRSMLRHPAGPRGTRLRLGAVPGSAWRQLLQARRLRREPNCGEELVLTWRAPA